MPIMQLGYWVPHRFRAGRGERWRSNLSTQRPARKWDFGNCSVRFAIKEAWETVKKYFSKGKRSQATYLFQLHFAISCSMCMYPCAHINVQSPLWQSKRFFEVLWGEIWRSTHDVIHHPSHLILHTPVGYTDSCCCGFRVDVHIFCRHAQTTVTVQ